MDVHVQAYREEAYEYLAELESSLLELEDHPEDADLIGRVFRVMHTIKGSGAMFGFDDIAGFTHEVETVFDQVRNGQMAVSSQLVTLTLAARDQIKAMLAASEHGTPVDAAESVRIVAGLRELSGKGDRDAPGVTAAAAAHGGETEPVAVTYRILVTPVAEIFASGTNPLALLNELRELGPCQAVAQLGRVPAIDEIDPEHCYVAWHVVLTTDRGIEAIRDVFVFAEDVCELKIEVIDDGSASGGYKKLGEILVEKGELAPDALAEILASQKRIGTLAIEKGVHPEAVTAALVEQQHVKQQREERQKQESAASIRVPADKLDLLVNLVGEMVTVQARFTQTAVERRDPKFKAIAEEVERLTGELRDIALNIRMLPIGSTFSKFKRLVRDLSAELGKEIEMTTAGADTELDKTVIEKLNDPLVHLLRNSIDHGIELPEVRAAGGKPRQGTVHLAAQHAGDSVILSIKDDGAGLDREAIRAKAVERGLIPANAELSEKEIFGQIFAPGFSTAKQVTSVSGRGVGMDVVKRSIEALRGSIEIDSRRGEGTLISIRIPLTPAIIESLMVMIGGNRYLLPLSLVDQCVLFPKEDRERCHGRDMVNVRGRMIPFIPIRERFGLAGKRPDIEQIVIVEMDGMQVGLVVDYVIGEHQTVIKSLGPAYKDVRGVSGATILGDGAVALILDLPQIVQSVENEAA
ncbi:chemotaxis protein CheA [Geomesophilobacter sediminis]|uniref:Chemotaxis protein CheA n=1 Tax=Geomesophilobacter sediminis TaxID=2798584 RepID=A0A8J7JH05_9BACT|nr:chemotaxis protein CheA [Geomesophilobacter sediminis]MBJ6723780.1 chemotaxis protein CheA [Geomesophilobacter sediminis]